MRKKIIAGLIVAYVAAVVRVHAALITSTNDPALAGAILETFDTRDAGSFGTRDYDYYTMQSAFSILNYESPAPGADRYLLVHETISFHFRFPVSAFGVVFQWLNRPHEILVFDTAGALLETVPLPDQIGTFGSQYSSFHGFASPSANIGSFTINQYPTVGSIDDVWKMDNFYFVPGPDTPAHVPDSGSTLAMLGAAFAALHCARRFLPAGRLPVVAAISDN